MRMLLIIGLVLIAVIALWMILQPAGPRVTTIERRRVSEDKDEPEDRDHA